MSTLARFVVLETSYKIQKEELRFDEIVGKQHKPR